MEVIIILVVVVFVFSITIGLVIMNRDNMPDILAEENEKELVEEEKETIDDEII